MDGHRELRPTGLELIDYFRAKRDQLSAMVRLAACSHPGLIGSHREEIQRIYLREVLPRRFEVGRGMVYGPHHRSREADIVLWDAQNYPSLPMADHSFYFATSVKAVIESKSTFSTDTLEDVLLKTKSVRDIVPHDGTNLDDLLEMMLLDIRCLKEGRTHGGMMISPAHIGTAAMFLQGGSLKSLAERAEGAREDLDDVWPDVVILLEPGVVAVKEPLDDYRGIVYFYQASEDCLLVFTTVLLQLLQNRVAAIESPHYMLQYARDFRIELVASVEFRPTRFFPSRIPLSGERLSDREV